MVDFLLWLALVGVCLRCAARFDAAREENRIKREIIKKLDDWAETAKERDDDERR